MLHNDDRWNVQKNARRCELLDKKIQGTLTDTETIELQELQREAMAYRDAAARPRLEVARQLHRELLEKKKQKQPGEQ